MVFLRSWLVVLAIAIVFDLSLGTFLVDPPKSDCGPKPPFGEPNSWSFGTSCDLSYTGNLRIPAGSFINQPINVVGSLSFDNSTDNKYSLIVKGYAPITTNNLGVPLDLPTLPVNVIFLNLQLPTHAELIPIIKTVGTTLNSLPHPRVDFSIIGNPSGIGARCAIVHFSNRTTNDYGAFGYTNCEVVYPPRKSDKKIIIIIVSTVSVAVVILLVGIGVFCYCRFIKRKKATEENQTLLGESKFINR